MVKINGIKFNDAEFHNGEVIFEATDIINKDKNIIELFFKDNKDITAVMFARQWLKDKCPKASCELIMKYCPYERMDREINNQLFSMKYFAQILAKFDFARIHILDPHSEVCVDLIKEQGMDVNILNLEEYVNKVINTFKPDYIFYPDKGAAKKYPNVLTGINIMHFFGKKKRDLANKGRIMDYELVDSPELKGKKILIIDDICCLGGTSYNAAKLMKEQGAKEVAFYISHCENGIFAGKLLKPDEAGEYIIDKIYTADTMLIDDIHDNIVII